VCAALNFAATSWLTARVQLHRRAAWALEAIPPSAAGATAAELASHHERGHQIPQALRYYAKAAELALMHFAALEALSITDHARHRTLLGGAERRRRNSK
jgi:hypothetical protein